MVKADFVNAISPAVERLNARIAGRRNAQDIRTWAQNILYHQARQFQGRRIPMVVAHSGRTLAKTGAGKRRGQASVAEADKKLRRGELADMNTDDPPPPPDLDPPALPSPHGRGRGRALYFGVVAMKKRGQKKNPRDVNDVSRAAARKALGEDLKRMRREDKQASEGDVEPAPQAAQAIIVNDDVHAPSPYRVPQTSTETN